ncbi:MAG: bifunctional DNA-formamidopyrimidine glycosylase/DNA-(apurinic or apyrimidinic site) lyase [Chloroflexota bacterium]|nr:bifunctional DNA-formamidopyrimidine glycosylase/DNA-(apurinic or apyrimidinic site) lyase [Chloroflexota bacterium]
MPELPEVETIVRRLRNGSDDYAPVPGHVIGEVKIYWEKIVDTPDVPTFKADLVGKTVKDVQRRGKFLHFPLDEGHLIGHLRMSGDMLMEKRVDDVGNAIKKKDHDQAIFNFEAPWRLVLTSVRKFSRVYYVTDPQEIFGKLGPEPLGKDFSADELYKKLHEHSRQIKPLLMDQSFLAGLGNIYTDEILYTARIHPLRKSDSISKEEARAIYDAMQKILKKAISKLGSSLDWMYRGGEYQNHFLVHQREGEQCPGCSGEVKKITVGQRSTYFCPNCQKAPKDS